MILSTSTSGSVFRLLGVFVLFLIILFVTYYVTRYLAKFQSGSLHNKNIKSFEVYPLSNGKYIQILKVGKKYFVIAVTKDSITNLGELNEDELSEYTIENDMLEKPEFKKIFEEFSVKFQNKQKK